MAHFAELNSANEVLRVTVVEKNFLQRKHER